MSKTYQLKMTAPRADAKTHDATPAAGKSSVMVQAQPGARYQLTDVQTGFAPDNIRVSRSGKHLRILVDGQPEPAFVIENFYDQASEDHHVLTGKAEDGNTYAYIPESASTAATVAQLQSNGQTAGMALGGAGIAAGAAVGMLAPVAVFNPMLLAAGALGAAALAGGGGQGDGNAPNKNLKVKVVSVSDDTGWLSNDFVTSDPTLTIKGVIEAGTFTTNGDKVLVQIVSTIDQVVAQTYADPSSGQWSFDNTGINLPDGSYFIRPYIVDAAGNTVKAGIPQPLVIDANIGLNLAIQSISLDSGSDDDWITNDSSPVFSGSFGSNKKWANNGDQFVAQIYDSKGQLVGSYGNTAISTDGATWLTTESGLNLAEGHYTVRAAINSATGQVHHVTEKSFTIDKSVALSSRVNEVFDTLTNNYTKITLTVGEAAKFELREISSGNVLSNGTFSGTTTTHTFSTLSKAYLNQDVELWIIDLNGNSSKVNLAAERYLSKNTDLILNPSSAISNPSTDFSTLVTYDLTVNQQLDFTSHIPASPKTGDRIVCNDLNMRDASAQSVTISLNDVLNLATTNTFIKTGDYLGDLQMRITGTVDDKVHLSTSDGWTLLANTLVNLHNNPNDLASDKQAYRVYTGGAGKLDLFIQENITVVFG